MKYEKLAEAILSILSRYDYDYKMYKGADGKRTSNPYDARYFYVKDPNLMFIIDEADNTLTLHKTNISFDKFKKLHSSVREVTRNYFINLDIRDYNKSFTPKDFASVLSKHDKRIEDIRNESTYRRNFAFKETYRRGNESVDITSKNGNMVATLNNEESIALLEENNLLIPYIVESMLEHKTINSRYIRRLYEVYDARRTLSGKSTRNDK